MSLITLAHHRFVHRQRTDRLATLLVPLFAANSSVLDIGAGDGRLAASIQRHRPDLSLRGIDVLVRQDTAIPVEWYDGVTIPMVPNAVDYTLLVDVLHHVNDPEPLLREAARVSRIGVILKDHLAENRLDHWILSLMDWVGNSGHGVNMTFKYMARKDWGILISRTGLDLSSWIDRVGLYPPLLSSAFGRGLHFIAVLSHPSPACTARL